MNISVSAGFYSYFDFYCFLFRVYLLLGHGETHDVHLRTISASCFIAVTWMLLDYKV